MRNRLPAALCLSCPLTLPAQPAEPRRTIHGRAHFYNADGQLRIWHIGTHHEYQPDEASWGTVQAWLEAGVKGSDRHSLSPASTVSLFEDFVICPTEPFKKGAVQSAFIKSVTHRRYVADEK